MVLPQAMAWVQYWFCVLSLKFCGKSKKLRRYISGISRFLHVSTYVPIKLFFVCVKFIQLWLKLDRTVILRAPAIWTDMYKGMLNCRIFSSLLWWADLLPLGEEVQDHVHHLPQEQSNSCLMMMASDMKFFKYFTWTNFQAKNFTH